jgi:acetyl-CoA carboxylase biotin carboxyl carrier protein
VDIRKVKKLIELLEESGIAEIEIREGDDAVRISRYSPAAAPPPVAVQAAAPAALSIAGGEAQTGSASPSPAPPSGHQVTAPMVGTYYSSPTPGARQFVELGSQVEVGDTLCIVEAMKMMNQIEAEVAGRIVSIMVENGEPVEYGQVLFIID